MYDFLLYDTSAWIDFPPIEEGESLAHILPTTIVELEKLKYDYREDVELSYKVRRAIRKMVEMDSKDVINFSAKAIDHDIKKYHLCENNDSRIICEALRLAKKEANLRFIFVTSDFSQFINAKQVLSSESNIRVRYHSKEKEVERKDYMGWEKVNGELESPVCVENPYNLIPNEYGEVYINDKLTDLVCFEDDMTRKIEYKDIHSHYMGDIVPLNNEQKLAFDLLQNRRVPIKLLIGKFGSGKTMLALAHAIDLVQRRTFDKIVYIRNNVPVKDTKDIGALPNDMIEKIKPYLMPIADHVGGEDGLFNLLAEGILEALPLGFLRGRDYHNTIILVDECENMTKQHVQLILGRCGENSEVWFLGDIKQTDGLVFEKNSGTIALIEKLSGDPLFGMVKFIKSERSEVASLADKLD